MTNDEVLLAYHNNNAIVSAKLNVSDEWAGQVMAFETLRQLMAHGLSAQAWNSITDCAWLRIVALACDEATLHPGVMMHTLSIAAIMASADLGGNYFEHGYQVIINGLSAENKVTFTLEGGVV